VIGLPITTTFRPFPARLTLRPPEGGVWEESYILCDQIRTISTERLLRHMGRVEARRLTQALGHVRFFLNL
jgi:mRNA interferase MazF